jgi:hypothetical protein
MFNMAALSKDLLQAANMAMEQQSLNVQPQLLVIHITATNA